MAKPRIFYGYWIIAIAFLCLFVYSGVGYYALSLFYKPLEAEFGWGRGPVSAGFTLIYIVQGLTAPYIGRMVDIYGPKRLIVGGAFITGVGFIALYFIHHLWSFYVCYGIIGLGMTAFSTIPATKLVTMWFKKRRGFAVGIASSGVGAAAFVLMPVIGSYLMPNFGWRLTYVFLGLVTWVLVIPLAILIVKARPEDMGLLPDGAIQPEKIIQTTAPEKIDREWTLSTALHSLPFWLITIAFTAGNMSHTTVIQHQVNHLTDLGFPVAAASVALGTVGLGSTIGKFLFGWACDHVRAKNMAITAYFLQVIGLIALLSLKPTSPPEMVWLFVIPFSLGIGGWLPNMSMIISSNFGLAAYGAIFGALNLAVNMGVAFGPLIGGFMYDKMHNYQGVFILLLVLYAVALTAMTLVRRPRLPQKK
ncbi:MAG: MFS transporter [Dehalococcoidales bacterium]|nr:MFS transporter [Dehalococcoidales bacterium]